MGVMGSWKRYSPSAQRDAAECVYDEGGAVEEAEDGVDVVGGLGVVAERYGRDAAADDERRAHYLDVRQTLFQPVVSEEDVGHERHTTYGRHDGLRGEAEGREVADGADHYQEHAEQPALLPYVLLLLCLGQLRIVHERVLLTVDAQVGRDTANGRHNGAQQPLRAHGEKGESEEAREGVR